MIRRSVERSLRQLSSACANELFGSSTAAVEYVQTPRSNPSNTPHPGHASARQAPVSAQVRCNQSFSPSSIPSHHTYPGPPSNNRILLKEKNKNLSRPRNGPWPPSLHDPGILQHITITHASSPPQPNPRVSAMSPPLLNGPAIRLQPSEHHGGGTPVRMGRVPRTWGS